MNKICILGSINMDFVIAVEHIPQTGETITASDQKTYPGGKGNNQAVACSRLGAEVSFIGKIGNDEPGDILLRNICKEGINTDYIKRDKDSVTGRAIILLSKKGENSIVVLSGANMNIKKEEIQEASEVIKSSDVVISQFEVPMEAIICAFEAARKNNVLTVLNPAPAKEVPDRLIKLTDIIIPNETEVQNLTGIRVDDIESAREASAFFLKKGVKYVIITMGSTGAILVSGEEACLVPAYKVENVVDTTAAGDSFIGALSSRICRMDSINFEAVKESIKFGNYVSSIVVQRKGAAPSIPYFDEVEKAFPL